MDCDFWLNWWFEYQVWNVPNEFICPKVTSNATKAPKTVRYPLRPGSSSPFDQLPDWHDTRESEGVSIIFVVVERHSIVLELESRFSWTCMRCVRISLNKIVEEGVVRGIQSSIKYSSYWGLIPLTPIDLDTSRVQILKIKTRSDLTGRVWAYRRDIHAISIRTSESQDLTTTLVRSRRNQCFCFESTSKTWWRCHDSIFLELSTRLYTPRCTTWKHYIQNNAWCQIQLCFLELTDITRITGLCSPRCTRNRNLDRQKAPRLSLNGMLRSAWTGDLMDQ